MPIRIAAPEPMHETWLSGKKSPRAIIYPHYTHIVGQDELICVQVVCQIIIIIIPLFACFFLYSFKPSSIWSFGSHRLNSHCKHVRVYSLFIHSFIFFRIQFNIAENHITRLKPIPSIEREREHEKNEISKKEWWLKWWCWRNAIWNKNMKSWWNYKLVDYDYDGHCWANTDTQPVHGETRENPLPDVVILLGTSVSLSLALCILIKFNSYK